jgi:hypothetical protein
MLFKGAGPSVSKYPGTLTITVEAVERPPPLVTVTDPFQDIRPRLPAGYGSGFETGAGIGRPFFRMHDVRQVQVKVALLQLAQFMVLGPRLIPLLF